MVEAEALLKSILGRRHGDLFFVDPSDDMFVICMMQSPSQRGWVQPELKALTDQALGR